MISSDWVAMKVVWFSQPIGAKNAERLSNERPGTWVTVASNHSMILLRSMISYTEAKVTHLWIFEAQWIVCEGNVLEGQTEARKSSNWPIRRPYSFDWTNQSGCLGLDVWPGRPHPGWHTAPSSSPAPVPGTESHHQDLRRTNISSTFFFWISP